mgnify:CR=1 FL=1
MKRFIIIRIANLLRKKIHVAKNVQIKHLTYMYDYSYMRLLKSYYKVIKL